MSNAKHTPGPLTTAPGNAIHLRLPMGSEGDYRIVWSEQTGRDVAYVLPPPTRTDEEGEVHAEPLDDAAEIVRRWNAFPDLLAACRLWDEGFVEGEQFTAEQFRVWVNNNRRAARAAIAKAAGN